MYILVAGQLADSQVVVSENKKDIYLSGSMAWWLASRGECLKNEKGIYFSASRTRQLASGGASH